MGLVTPTDPLAPGQGMPRTASSRLRANLGRRSRSTAGATTTRPELPEPANRILAVKLADIGDALGIEPALATLRAGYPRATLDVLVTPNARAALSTCPHVDSIIDFEKHIFDDPRGLLYPRRLLAAGRFLLALRRRRYDRLIVFHHLPSRWGARKFSLVARAVGAPVVAGLDNGRGAFLTHAAYDRGFGALPEWRYWLEVTRALGLTPIHRPPVFVVPPAAQAEADAIVAGLDWTAGPLVALHPSVGGYAPIKQWPVERFIAVARDLIDSAGATILIVGGAETAMLGAELARRLGPSAADLTGRTTLPVLAGLLRRCRLLIGNDSGVAHLADAVGCRTLAIFGPTNAAAWAPARAHVITLPLAPQGRELPVLTGDGGVALRVDEPCSPCYYAGFETHGRGVCYHRNCLHHLTTDTVATVAREMLTAD